MSEVIVNKVRVYTIIEEAIKVLVKVSIAHVVTYFQLKRFNKIVIIFAQYTIIPLYPITILQNKCFSCVI